MASARRNSAVDLAAHKENALDAGVGFQPSKFRATAAGKLATPRTPFHVLSDGRQPTTRKKGLGGTTPGTRRALGDISNHVNGANRGGDGDFSLVQKKITFDGKKSGGSDKRNKTPMSKKSHSSIRQMASTTSTAVSEKGTRLQMDEDLEIESAYGGLPGLGTDMDYLNSIRNEIELEMRSAIAKPLKDELDAAKRLEVSPLLPEDSLDRPLTEVELPPEEPVEDCPPDEFNDPIPLDDLDESLISLDFSPSSGLVGYSTKLAKTCTSF